MAPLLWIVKTADSKSLSHSERKEQRQIFSQAQRTSLLQKAAKTQRLAQYPPSSQDLQALSGSVCAIAQPHDHAVIPIHRDRHGLRVDPFSPITHQDSAFAWRVIDFFTHVVVPSQNFFDDLFNVHSTYGRFVLQPLFHEDLHYAALVAFYSSLHHLQRPDHKMSEDVIRCTVKALSKHRAHLRDLDGKADELAIYTALMLTLFAEATDDIKSFAIHRSKIKVLVDSAGGFRSLPPASHVRRILPHWDSFWSLGLGNDTSFVFTDTYSAYVPQYPPYPFTVEIGGIVARLPSGFQELAKQQRMALDVLELLARVIDTIAGHSQSTDFYLDPTPPSTMISRRYNSYWEASPCLRRANTANDVPDLERSIVLALVLYCCHTFIPQRAPIMIYRAARQRLSADIPRTFSNGQRQPDVMLWVGMNVVDSWRKPNRRLCRQAGCLLRNMKKSFPSINSNDELHNGLKRFMWNESFGERCVQYWNFKPGRNKGFS